MDALADQDSVVAATDAREQPQVAIEPEPDALPPNVETTTLLAEPNTQASPATNISSVKASSQHDTIAAAADDEDDPGHNDSDDDGEESDPLEFDSNLIGNELLQLILPWKDRATRKWKDTVRHKDLKVDTLPVHYVYEPEFAHLAFEASKIIKDNITVLEDSKFTNKDTRSLIEKLSCAQEFEGPEPLVIGIRGNTGAGKSFFVNNLLSEPGLSLKGSLAEACTYVPFVFEQARKDQSSKFRADVNFLERDEMKATMCEWITALRPSKESTECEASEADEVKEAQDSTLDNMTTVFGFRSECNTIDNARAFLGACFTDSLDDEAIVRKMWPWLEEIEELFKVSERRAVIESENTRELNDHLVKYTRGPLQSTDGSGNATRASPWPLVSHVTVRFDNALLNRGIVVIDLPGLSDTNRVRTLSTQRHLGVCKRVLVVAEYTRFVSNTDSKAHVQSSANIDNNLNENILVVTKIGAGIDEDLITVAPDSDVVQTVRQLTELKAAILAESRKWSAKSGKLKRNKAMEQLLLLTNVTVAQNWAKVIDGISRDVKVEYRIAYAETSMHANWRNMTMPRFRPVSNKDYEAHLKGWDADTEMPMSLDNTGVSRLRGELSGWPTAGYIEKMEFMLEVNLDRQLLQLEYFANMSSLQMADKVIQILQGPSARVKEYVKSMRQNILSDLLDTVLQHIPKDKQKWTQSSLEAMEPYLDERATHHKTFNSVIRNRGVKKLGKAIKFDWNVMILEVVPPILRPRFVAFQKCVKARIAVFLEEMIDQVVGMEREINDLVMDSVEGLAHLRNGLLALKRDLVNANSTISSHMDEIVAKLVAVTCTNHPESPVLKQLNKVYDEAISLRAKTVTKLRRQLLSRAVRDGDLFESVGKCIGELTKKDSSSWANHVARRTIRLFRGLEITVETNLIKPKGPQHPELVALKGRVKDEAAAGRQKQQELKDRFRMIQGARNESHPSKLLKMEPTWET